MKPSHVAIACSTASLYTAIAIEEARERIRVALGPDHVDPVMQNAMRFVKAGAPFPDVIDDLIRLATREDT